MKKTIREKLQERIHELKGQWYVSNYKASRINYRLASLDIAIAEKSLRKWSGKNIEDVTSTELTTFFALSSGRRKLRREMNSIDLKIEFLKLLYCVAGVYGSICDLFTKKKE